MGAPQGYTALGLVGYTDKGTYLASATYNRYNVVLYNGSSYVAIKDGITGVTPSNDGVNWRLFANGFPENGISTDNFQETLKQYISNSGTVNQEGFALDARQGNPNVAGSLAAQLNTLSSGIKIIEPVISSSSEAYGGYCSLGDIVMTTLRLKVLTSVPGYTQQISVPAPKYGAFTVYDSDNANRFQINDSGVFQNVATLEAGNYTVFAIYIK